MHLKLSSLSQDSFLCDWLVSTNRTAHELCLRLVPPLTRVLREALCDLWSSTRALVGRTGLSVAFLLHKRLVIDSHFSYVPGDPLSILGVFLRRSVASLRSHLPLVGRASHSWSRQSTPRHHRADAVVCMAGPGLAASRDSRGCALVDFLGSRRLLTISASSGCPIRLGPDPFKKYFDLDLLSSLLHVR